MGLRARPANRGNKRNIEKENEMGKTLTPIFSLAVVVALALAAVFGSMSLANPAMAGHHETTVYAGLTNLYDAKPLFGVTTVPTGATFAPADTDPQDPAGVLQTFTCADTGICTLERTAAFPAGASSLSVELTVVYDADGSATDEDPVDMTVDVTVMGSEPVARAMTSDTPSAPVTIDDVGLFTDFSSYVDVSSMFNSGMGTGEIKGYNATFTSGLDGTTPEAEVEDATPTTDDVNVGSNGMVKLKGLLELDSDAVVTVTPRCPATDGTDATVDCAGGVTATFNVQVAESMPAMGTDNDFPAVTLQITGDDPFPSESITLIGNVDSEGMADPDADYFMDGTGKGMIDRWVVSSTNGFAITGSVTDNVLTVSGYEAGVAEVTVIARDGLDTDPNSDADDDPTKKLRVRVLAEEEEAVEVNTPALENGFIDNRSIQVGGAALRLDVRMYFTAGEGDGAITNYTFESSSPDKATVNSSSPTGRLTAVAVAAGTTVITVTAEDGNAADDPTQDFILTVMAAYEAPTPDVFTPRAPMAVKDNPDTDVNETVDAYSFMATSDEPGDSARYDIEFAVMNDVDTLNDELTIELEDFGFPSSVDTRSIGITVDEMDGTGQDRQFSPETVTVDGEKLVITIGDMLTRDDAREDFTISAGSNVDVVIRQNADITIPTEAKMDDYGPVIELGSEPEIEGFENNSAYPEMQIDVLHYVKLDPDDGGLGEMVTAKGLGFKNGTSLTVFRDSDNNGVLTSADNVLCTDLLVEGNIGTCQFEVTHPTFTAGDTNHIDAVDGVNATADGKSDVFELKASIGTSPDGGSPGERILVQLVDFDGSNVTKVTIGGQVYCDGKMTPPGARACSGSINNQGSGNFSITIPNWARGGKQELKVWDDAGTSASTKITLVGPQIRMTDTTVIANQRVSLIGTGFSPGAAIANVDNLGTGHLEPVISIGGDPIPDDRINDGDPVRVDNGGNWSASVDLPLSEATTAAGKRQIRVRDSLARTGVIEVNVKSRSVTVTPEEGRVGTIALIQGEGFPSKNDEGSSFTVEIEYEAENGNTVTISALTDASGRFEAQMRVPTTAAIPSSNQIHVRFDDDDDVTVALTVPHDVPEGIIQPSETSGGPGSTITINGEGFKSFVPVALVKIGTLDVTPAPKPSTDGNGQMSFDIIIPGLDVGIQTIEVNVGRTTASVGFTVTESGVNPGDIKPVAEAIEPLTDADNLVSVWNFNNDTKVWAFYDPTLAEGNTLTHMITGETYLIRIKANAEVILNRDTRSLTCVGSNCWNQLVW